MEKEHTNQHELPLCEMFSICKGPYKVETMIWSHKEIMYVELFSSHQVRKMGTRIALLF